MRDAQVEIIKNLQVRPTIDAQTEIESRVSFLVNYLLFAGAKGYVLGVSGGQDSSLTARLAQLACERLRSAGHTATFTAVRLPYGVQADEADAVLALEFIQPDEQLTFNIKPAVDALAEGGHGVDFKDFTRGNSKARMRMLAQYAIAGERAALVIGTDHAAEAVTGFFTKFGDGACDVTPLTGLTKGQGRALLEQLDAPQRLYLKTPTADLLDGTPGRADEDELGLTYADIDTYLTGGTIDPQVAERIEAYYRRTRHKRAQPVTPFDDWWK